MMTNKKSVKFAWLCAVLTVCTGFASCQSGGDEVLPEEETSVTQGKERQDIPLTRTEESIVQGNNVFGFKLLQAVAEGEKDNVFLSPLSATLALGMLNNGAAGVTSEEIRRGLGYADVSTADINEYFLKMLTALKEVDPEVTLESANSVWLRKDFQPLPAFTEVNQSKYDAEVRSEDFADPATLDLINAWCSDKTHGMIDRILEDLNPSAALYLMNALYFKGAWTEPFEKEETKDDTFTREDGSTSTVPMMQRTAELKYARTDLFEAVEAPYGNEAFSTVFLLPAEGVSLSSVVEQLDAATWNDALSKLSTYRVQLGIPRIELAYEILLNVALQKLGMVSMFGGEDTDFSGIHPTIPLEVSLVKQKTALKLNEEGSEAAAATIVEVVDMADPNITPLPPMPFILNRPFLLFIKEKSTGAVLFEGIVRGI